MITGSGVAANLARGHTMTAQRLVLRESKLRVPVQRPGTVERTRLLASLARSSDKTVVLISAPAGYGKSIVASQWTAHDHRSVGWLQLDHGDNDPVRLLSYLAGALFGASSIPADLLAELSRSTPRIDDVILPALADRLASHRPTLLVLDDVHVLGYQRCLQILAFLLDQVPDGSQIAVLTRADLDIPLARLRVDGRLAEIRAPDLALDIGEIQDVAMGAGMAVDRQTAALLKHRTEGWAAGVTLAASALRSKERVQDEIAGITGDRREIAEYLIEVGLADLDPELQLFLLATSLLQWMSGPLCDAVLGIEGSTERLASLTRSNQFIVPLDDRRERYRYHQMFGELLRVELERRHPASIAGYLARAAAWHEEHGDVSEAFEYARACGDFERAGRVALGCWNRYVGQGRLGTMRLWMEACTDAELVSESQLALAAAWIALYQGDLSQASRYTAAASKGDLDRPSADGSTSLRSAVANIRSVLAPEGLHQMLRDGALVRASEREARSRWLVSGSRAIGVANLLLGRRDDARAAFDEGLALTSKRPDWAYLRIALLGYMALSYADEGDWRSARRWAKEARTLIDAQGLTDLLTSVPAYVAWASVLQRTGAAERASAELRAVDRIAPTLEAMPWLVADTAIRCGGIWLAIGDRDRARQLADVAREALARYPDPGLLPERLRHLEVLLEAAHGLQLTPMELRLLPYLATHLSLQEIGERLFISRSTVKTHVESVYAKLEVTSRSEAVVRLERLGLIPGPFGSGATVEQG